MPDNSYTRWNLFKKIWQFLCYIFSYLRNHKKDKFNKVSDDIKEEYDKIDKKNNTEKDDLNKRLKNLF